MSNTQYIENISSFFEINQNQSNVSAKFTDYFDSSYDSSECDYLFKKYLSAISNYIYIFI